MYVKLCIIIRAYLAFFFIKSLKSPVLSPSDRSDGLCPMVLLTVMNIKPFSQWGWRRLTHTHRPVWNHYTGPVGAGGRSWAPDFQSETSVPPETSPQFHADGHPKQDLRLGASCCKAAALITGPSCCLKMFYMRASDGWVLCSLSVGVWKSHIWTHLLPENRAIWPFAGCGFNEETVIFYLCDYKLVSHVQI